MSTYPLCAVTRRGKRRKWTSARSQHAHLAREGPIKSDCSSVRTVSSTPSATTCNLPLSHGALLAISRPRSWRPGKAFNLDMLRPHTRDSHMLASTTPSTETYRSLAAVRTVEKAFNLENNMNCDWSCTSTEHHVCARALTFQCTKSKSSG